MSAAREAGIDAEIAILPERTHYISIRRLVSADDPTFRIIAEVVERLSR